MDRYAQALKASVLVWLALGAGALACSAPVMPSDDDVPSGSGQHAASQTPSSSAKPDKSEAAAPAPLPSRSDVAPTIASIDPPGAATSDSPAGVAIRVSGKGFESGDQLDVAGKRIAATVTGTTTIDATIPASSLAVAGILNIAVVSPSGAASTQTFAFVVSKGNGVAVTGLAPTSATQGASGVSLTVVGTGFKSDSVINFNGSDLTTHYQGSTLLTASLSSAQTKYQGKFSVFVRNVGGDVSAPSLFEVKLGSGSGGGGSCGAGTYGSCPNQDRGYCYSNGDYCGNDACIRDGYSYGCGSNGGGACNGGLTCQELGMSEGKCAFSVTYGWISCDRGCVYKDC